MSADDRIRDLVKGVALGLAEIERLRRSEGMSPTASAINAFEMVHKERLRQQRHEGYSAEHDDRHAGGELADAAACYLMTPESRATLTPHDLPPYCWPWEPEAWKPSTR